MFDMRSVVRISNNLEPAGAHSLLFCYGLHGVCVGQWHRLRIPPSARRDGVPGKAAVLRDAAAARRFVHIARKRRSIQLETSHD
jgi:hypothetical protein